MTKILVVEDDRFLANAYRMKLVQAGFEVLLASDGEEAMAVLATTRPDLMILDLIMPKKDGFSVLEELHANPAWQALPVLIASNLGQEEDVKRGLQLGAKDFVIKTDMSLNDLVSKIQTLLTP